MRSSQKCFAYVKALSLVVFSWSMSAFAYANEIRELVIRQPITCELVEAHYSRDVTTTSGSNSRTNLLDKSYAQLRDEAKRQAEKDINTKFGARSKLELNGNLSPAGATASGRGHLELYAEYDFNAREKSKKEEEIQKATIKHLEAQGDTVFASSGSDWKLRVELMFKNNTTNDFIVGTNGNVWAEIDGMKIRVPISEEFTLTAEGESPSKIIDVAVLDEKIRRLLFAHEANDTLKSKLKLVVDENLIYRDAKSNANLRPMKEDHPLWVYVNFGDAKKETPVKIRTYHKGKRTTYLEALQAVNESLKQTVPNLFVFDKEGGLLKVLDKDFGKPNETTIVLAKVADKVMYKLQKSELDRIPDRGGNKKELWFEDFTLLDIANQAKSGNEEIKRICREAIEEKRNRGERLSYAEKYCAAMLNFIAGKQAAAFEYFALMSSDEYRQMALDEHDESLVLMLTILESAHDYSLPEMKRLKAMIEQLGVEKSAGFVEFAIRSGNINAYEALKACNFSMMLTNRTELGYAAELGKIEIVRWLLEECPDNKRQRPDMLIQGAKKKSVEDAGKTPLFWAAQQGHLEVCKYLVSKGADVNREFREPTDDGPEWYDELTSSKFSVPNHIQEYIKAARKVDYVRRKWIRWRNYATERDIREWVNHGVPPEARLGEKWTILSRAIELNNASLVEFLVDKGANVNGPYSTCPTDGRTALMLACELGDTNLVVKLISNGADMYAHQDDGMNAFYYAIKSRQYDCAKILLRHGFEVAKCLPVDGDKERFAPLEFIARFCDDKELCEMVKEQDNDAWIRMVYGYAEHFSGCLDRCDLSRDEIKDVLKSNHLTFDALRSRGLLKKLTSDDRTEILYCYPELEQEWRVDE